MRLQQRPQIINCHAAVQQDRTEQTRSDGFAAMHRNNGLSGVGVHEYTMVAFCPEDFESAADQGVDELDPMDARRFAQADTLTRRTATSWPPGLSGLPPGFGSDESGPWPSSVTSIASRTRTINLFKTFACVWHPRSSGTRPTYQPSSSFSIMARNSRFMPIPFNAGRYGASLWATDVCELVTLGQRPQLHLMQSLA
jgi:hypothetical protein